MLGTVVRKPAAKKKAAASMPAPSAGMVRSAVATYSAPPALRAAAVRPSAPIAMRAAPPPSKRAQADVRLVAPAPPPKRMEWPPEVKAAPPLMVSRPGIQKEATLRAAARPLRVTARGTLRPPPIPTIAIQPVGPPVPPTPVPPVDDSGDDGFEAPEPGEGYEGRRARVAGMRALRLIQGGAGIRTTPPPPPPPPPEDTGGGTGYETGNDAYDTGEETMDVSDAENVVDSSDPYYVNENTDIEGENVAPGETDVASDVPGMGDAAAAKKWLDSISGVPRHLQDAPQMLNQFSTRLHSAQNQARTFFLQEKSFQSHKAWLEKEQQKAQIIADELKKKGRTADAQQVAGRAAAMKTLLEDAKRVETRNADIRAKINAMNEKFQSYGIGLGDPVTVAAASGLASILGTVTSIIIPGGAFMEDWITRANTTVLDTGLLLTDKISQAEYAAAEAAASQKLAFFQSFKTLAGIALLIGAGYIIYRWKFKK